jgi:hypothetical protein
MTLIRDDLVMDTTEPTQSGSLPDYDDDGVPGLRIVKGGDVDGSDSERNQSWYATGPFTLGTNVSLTIYGASQSPSSATIDFASTLSRCTNDSGACASEVILGTASSGPRTYPGRDGAFSAQTVTFDMTGTLADRTIETGQRLRFRLYVLDYSDTDMAVGYDTTTHPAQLAIAN